MIILKSNNNNNQLRRNSRSAASLLSLVSSNGTNNSQKSTRQFTGSGRFSFLPFLANIKGSVSRGNSDSIAPSIDKQSSTESSTSTRRKSSIPRNSKSMTSLKSLESDSSSATSFSHLATPCALSRLEELDDVLEQIGRTNLIPASHSVSSSTICELSEHDSEQFFPIFFEEDDIARNISPSLQKSQIQRVHRGDFHRVCKIGRGGYSDVHMVVDHKREKCALKALNSSRLKNTETFVTAALDLAMEAKILSDLDHENIIQMRGICSEKFSASYTSGKGSSGEGYFLVLDLLGDVLSTRLNRWRKDNRRLSSGETRWRFGKTKVDTMIMYDRMQNVALGIAKGMIYLHEHGIVLRDLKPANVGFDDSGNVRLFDFGMARKLEDCDPNEICGSPRYMCPEVMAGKGYSFEGDVYSFGIILYEICSLNTAFDIIRKFNDHKEFYRLVVENNTRPKINKIPCRATIKLIEDCWQSDPSKRPSFKEIQKRIIDITSYANQ